MLANHTTQTDVNDPPHPAALYISEVTKELARLARTDGCEALSYLLELATIEAERMGGGEGVITTLHDTPAVELKPVRPTVKAITPDAIDWLVQRRVGRRMPREHAAAVVRKVRNEWTR